MSPKKLQLRRERVGKILPILKRTYPDAKCALDHSNPLELLVATILSAQCTDARVNIVTKDLFKKYKSAKAYAAIATEHQGKVPDSMDELTSLPGVGRKTANVVLGNAFGKN